MLRKRRFSRLLILFLLTAPVLTQPLELPQEVDERGDGIFHTYPGGASVILLDSSKSGSHLGKSGTRVPVPYGARGSITNFTYILRHPDGNHEDLPVTLPAGYFSSPPHRWPSSGVARLKPKSLWVGLFDLVRYPGWRTGLFLLSLPLAGTLGWAFYQVWLRQRLRSLGGDLGISPYQHYYRLRKLGGGGYGTVYLAVPRRSPSSDRLVALKVIDIPKEPHLRETLEVSFPREVKAIQDLNHPNIVSYYDSGRNGEDEFFLVMEYIRGSDLSHYVPSQGQPPSPRLLHFLKSLADALQAVHDKNIIHRDLKPENVMLREDGVVKLTDFGLAREQNKTSQHSQLHGSLQGTAGYFCPEQFTEGAKMSVASDQYAYAVVCSRLLAGHYPIPLPDPEDPMAIVLYADNVRRGRIQPLATVCPHFAQTSAVLEKMLSVEARDRYPSITQAYQALEEAYLQDSSANPGPERRPVRPPG